MALITLSMSAMAQTKAVRVESPIVSEKAHTRPFERKWLNIMAAILVPLGAFLYIRMWTFRLRLLKDLRVIKQTNNNIIAHIKEKRLDHSPSKNDITL